MVSVDDEIHLDDAKVTVTDEITLSEGTGDDETTTSLYRLSLQAETDYLVRWPDAGSSAPLYKGCGQSELQPEQRWIDREVHAKSHSKRFVGELALRHRPKPEPGDRLELGDSCWELESGEDAER